MYYCDRCSSAVDAHIYHINTCLCKCHPLPDPPTYMWMDINLIKDALKETPLDDKYYQLKYWLGQLVPKVENLLESLGEKNYLDHIKDG